MARYPDVEALVRRVRATLESRGYSPRTVRSYAGWIARFMRFHRGPHVTRLEPRHVEAFLEHLAIERNLAPKSRNLAASALAFLYKEVLGIAGIDAVARARGGAHVPLVLSKREVKAVLDELRGRYRLMAALMYGTGMRVSECVSLRLKDLDFELAQITVRDGKGRKDRYAVFPELTQVQVRRQMARVEALHQRDRVSGAGWTPLPGALHRKMPGAGWESRWQFLFPAARTSIDPATGRRGRSHVHASAMQRAMKDAVRTSGILKPATCHTLRHSFASQLLRDGYDIRQVKDLLGHKDVRTTMIYLHAVEQTGLGIRSPIDREEFGNKAVRRRPTSDRRRPTSD